MDRNQIFIYILSFLIVFIFIVFVFHNSGSAHFSQLPRSVAEKKLADLLHEQILQNNLSEFVIILNNYPQYINLVSLHTAYSTFFTPLQHAVILGRDDFIDELLKRGADPTLTTLSENNTLLHLASLPRTIRMFIRLGFDLEARNFQGMTPLLANTFKTSLNRKVIHALLKAGANPNARTNISKLTPLHILFKPHHANSNREDFSNILQYLLAYGAHIDATTKARMTPLHFAAQNDDASAIKILLNKAEKQSMNKRYVNIRNLRGDTPLAIAYKEQSKKAITQLLRLGANPLIRNNNEVSVNGDAHLRSSGESLEFSEFVLREIAKYFKPPSSYYSSPLPNCVQSLTATP